MAQHKIYIQDAIKLTGKSRRTLYRDMDAGNLSYHLDARDRRYFDPAELCRVYGELEGLEGQAPPTEPAPIPALPAGHDLEKMIQTAVAQAMEPLLDELRSLKAFQAEHLQVIEHQVKRLPAPTYQGSARSRGQRIAEQGAVDDPHGLHEIVRAMREKDEQEQNGGIH